MPPKGKATHFSSAKAAEALAARGGGGFGGFSGSAPAGASTGFAFGSKYVGQVAAAVPGAAAAAGDGSGARAAAAIIPADLDGELAQQLQKLSKRDATTKLKALQALRALAKDKPASDLQAALPSWAYLFGRLVMDGSRAVRAEACHVTAALAAAVGRGIAPLLKSLLPPLWLAQFDAYGEAAAAARGAFAAAFPAAAKQREALLFCRAEVLQLLSDNLASTPQSLGDAKKESVEELADRHERVLAASCGALAALLDLAAGQAGAAGTAAAGTEAAEPPAAEQEVLAGIQAEFELPPFYKAVMQSKAAPVRRAAYSLVAAAAERRPQLLAGSLAVGAAAVLGALGDKDPANHEAMWGMLLAYARAAPDSWRHVNMQKAFLPRLWAFLRHGCYGSAAASYPALLPLGSLLPPDVLGPHPGFFVSLLEAIWQGLPTLAGPGGGPAARQAAAAAFQDCLLYALLKSDQLAAMGGSAAAAAAPPAQQAQQGYCAEVLQAAVGGLLMPALTSAAAAPEAASAAEAQAVLAGAVGRLSSPSASVSSRERLDQLLQVLGASLAAAMQQALGSAAAEQQPEADSAAASAASSSELCERASALVTAVEQAAGPSGHAALGAAVAQPLVALLLPEVRSGSAPPAASSLLAALLKSFPQHAAADVARPESPSAAAAAAAATAAVPTDEMAALRLHQSASFTIESIVRRLGEEQQPEAAAANCDLLLSCLPQVHHPARKLADVLQQLLPQQAGGATSPAALLLLQRLVSGQHAELATAACRSAELDRAAAALSSSGSWLGGSDELTPQVLSLLLVGDGSTSLLSEAAQAALLGQLLQQLQAAVGALLHSCMAYCGQQLNQQQWSLVLEQLRTTLAACAASLAAAAARVAAAVCAAAAEVAVGADMGSPAVALQFFRRLKLKGVLERSAKARAEAGRVATTLAAELSDLDDQLLPQLLPSLQAYTRAAAVAGSSRSVAERDWQAAEAAVCGDALQLFVTAGSMAAAAAVCGDEAAAVLSDWMAGPLGAAQEEAGTEQGPAVWQLLSQVVATTLRGADRAFLLAAVDRANGGMDATGVDALGSLLALSLSGIPPASMAGAAFAAILQHPELTAALTAAEGVDEEALEEQQQQAAGGAASDSGDAAATLEQVGVRPELAAAVAGSPGSSGFYTGWSLLMAHVLAAPADSHGRRLLVQSVKEAHALVPALMDALVPLLPLEIGSGGRRRDSGGSAAGGGMPGGAAAAVSAAAGSRTSSGSSSGSAASAFASQLAELGPYPSGHSDDLAALSLAQQQHAQRFAVLLYAAVLQALPASARLWFADLRDRGTAAATERYTSGAVSGQLLAAELAAVTEAASTFGKFDKFSVRANATSREVIAVMEVEDGHMLELAVKLPAALPLRPPELECRRKVGVSEGRLRKWLLSISAFLRTQNGSVAEAISLWKRNVDKEFEGQEECLICYSIIQPTSGQLPRLGCRTCRKRFHGGCLYKWFKSSGKSNCPHCQSPW
ncbi:E3 ubiquitin- ligase listerin [Chlorella sorokiniana]|uniref:E3 ubiquitin-protein ligase listerin n=1 Tax=Chlorella sorokiniana TaxID=3076 RepID=A0A2P6TPP7_CHLSO|nr:E3 ubiquitin- ligase listerin [Chlorella sorokiniana]|eukprot:PRW55988.1 E3 ubiquitin- ligase listerin [Chlorella sorokiniana]